MDPIADMLTRIRNATAARKAEVFVPFSTIKATVADLLVKHGFLHAMRDEPGKTGRRELRLSLAYTDSTPAIRSIRRISKPGLRIYRSADKLPRPRGGFGIVLVSTPKGMMTTEQARRLRTGGELICEVLS